MKLGEMLVRDGRITQSQLEQALAHQTRVGGRIGSILVELGFMDAETLTVYLGLELGIPIATGATLERCKRSAVKLLSAQQAARYRCVPIVIQGQTLIIAIDDPHDIQSLDALHNITGYRILPRVSPEIRIYYYLERFYGVPRPTRYRALGESPRGNSALGSHPTSSGLPGPPLPGLPPRRSQPVTAPTPRPVVRRSEAMPAATSPPIAIQRPPPPVPATAVAAAASAAVVAELPSADTVPTATAQPGLRKSPQEQEALELDANDLVIELDSDDAEAAAAQSAPVKADSGAQPVPIDRGPRAVRTTAPIYVPRTLNESLDIISRTDQRGSVADAILCYAAGLFEVGVLCLVRDQFAVGWKGFGPNLDADRIDTLLVPLEMPSVFQIASKTRELVHAHAVPSTLHDHIFKVLRAHTPLYSIVYPISIGARVVNLFYAHKADGSDLGEDEMVDLRRIVAAAGDAYVRLISASKAQQRRKAE
ncbi:MAG TPA: hypothetical protein VFU21_01485 [Kofleriaceae bacterium]|nr:hypothetical protein [Kofleriaceae bacterium]